MKKHFVSLGTMLHYFMDDYTLGLTAFTADNVEEIESRVRDFISDNEEDIGCEINVIVFTDGQEDKELSSQIKSFANKASGYCS